MLSVGTKLGPYGIVALLGAGRVLRSFGDVSRQSKSAAGGGEC